MIFRIMTTLLLLATLSGCSAGRMAESMDSAGDVLQERVAAVEDAVQTAAPAQTTTPAQVTAPLTAEEAQAIALAHAGFTADQVRRLRTEYEIDDGVPRFEVQFRQGRFEYDYEIHAETGAILSYDRDD